MDVPKVSRSPWDSYPDTVIVAEERAVKQHAAYETAKTGDVGAAKELAAAFTTPAVIEKLRELAGSSKSMMAPVHAIEDQGINRIPAAFAELLAERMGLEVADDIIQANVVSHTGSTGWARIARPAVFDGPVLVGQHYFLVDDFIGQGGTLANLRGLLLAGGGHVGGAITLTGKSYSAKLALDPETLKRLRQKHGHELEIWWQETFGYGFERLTESEARYLLRAENADTVRSQLLETGS